jgi:hypothetical protein
MSELLPGQGRDGRAKVRVRRFLSGNSGESVDLERVERTLHRSSCYAPVVNGCADAPIVKTTYDWIEYEGERYAVHYDPIGDEYELTLAATKLVSQ